MAKVPKHPMQPIVKGRDGVPRFKQNSIVRYLIDHGSIGLNDIAKMPFSREDYEQLMQLIGYSVSGFGDLSCASKSVIAKADEEAEKLLR